MGRRDRHEDRERFDSVRANNSLPAVVARYLPDLKKQARGWVARCPMHDDRTPSFTLYQADDPKLGAPHYRYHCFGCGRGGDVVDFIAWAEHTDTTGALELLGDDRFRPSGNPIPAPVSMPRWKPIVPVPGDAPRIDLGAIVFPEAEGGPKTRRIQNATLFAYCDAEGELLGYVARREKAAGGKVPLTLTFARPPDGSAPRWAAVGFPRPRPLLGLPGVAARPDAPRIVVSGEKCQAAAERMLPDYVAVTWPNGDSNAIYADWTPLRGSIVYLWPDLDRQHTRGPGGEDTDELKPYWEQSGPRSMREIARILRALECDVWFVNTEADFRDGTDLPDAFDVADAEAMGWSGADVADFIERRLCRFEERGVDGHGDDRAPGGTGEAADATDGHDHDGDHDPTPAAAETARLERNAARLNAEIECLDFAALAGLTPPPRRWIVNDWIPRGHVTLLAGAGGVGKSLLCQQLATAVACGMNFIDYIHDPGPVLGLFCEDDRDEIWRRQEAVCRHWRIPMDQLTGRLYIDARAGKMNALTLVDRRDSTLGPSLLQSILREKLDEIGETRLLILDNVGQMYNAGDAAESDRAKVTAFANMLTGIAQDYDCGILLLTHPAKAEGSTYSGSTAWENAVRSRLMLKRQDPTNPDSPLLLTREKSNYARIGGDIVLRWEKGAYKMVDGRLTPTEEAELENTNRAHETAVIRALRFLTSRKITTSEGSRAANYLPKMLSEYSQLDGMNEDQAAAAMRRLIAQGRLIPKSELWRNDRRQSVLGLAIAEPPHPDPLNGSLNGS